MKAKNVLIGLGILVVIGSIMPDDTTDNEDISKSSVSVTTTNSNISTDINSTSIIETQTPTEVQTEPPTTIAPTEPPETVPVITDAPTYTYILNTNTKKFHYPSCSSVKQMKASNKEEYTGNRNDVISQGYDSCQRCNP